MRKVLFSKSNGSVLITALWIMSILALLALGIGFRASLELRLSKFRMDMLEARYLAEAGIVKTQDYLSRDEREYDTISECGIALSEEETPETIFAAASNILGNGTFSVYYLRKKEYEEGKEAVYGMLDEERKINIALTCLEKTADYRAILKSLSSGFTDDVIEAIIDWQDEDLTGPAESAYYESLEHPYRCTNEDFGFLEELTLVKGMTEELFDEIKDSVTVYGDEKININTASAKVLRAVLRDHQELVDDIVAWRSREDIDVDGWSNIGKSGDALDFKKFVEDRVSLGFVDDIIAYFTVTSNNFTITCHGEAGGTHKVITCVVERQGAGEGGLLRYYHEEP